jgi:hypothetical protein
MDDPAALIEESASSAPRGVPAPELYRQMMENLPLEPFERLPGRPPYRLLDLSNPALDALDVAAPRIKTSR